MDSRSSPVTEHGVRPARWVLVACLMLISSFAFVDRVALALLVDPIKHDLHATDVQMSLLLGLAFAFCYGLFGIPSGHFADRLDRRRLIAVASLGWASMTIVCGMATSLTQLFIGRAGVGLMEAMLTPAAYSLIRDSVPARSRGLAFSLYALAPLLGGAVSLAGGGTLLRLAAGGAFAGVPWLGSFAPWQVTLIVIGLLGLPLSLPLLALPEPKREHRPDPASGGIVAGLAEACRYIAAHRALYMPLLIFAGTGAMMSFSYNGWFPTALARRFAVAPHAIGPVLGGIALGGGAAGLVVGGLVMNALARHGRSVMIYASVAVIGTMLGVGAACLVPSLSLAFVAAAIAMFFLGISNPAGATMLSQTTPPAMMGRVGAVYLLAQTLVGQTLGPLSVALAGEHLFTGPSAISSGLVVVELFCAVIAVTCAVMMVRRASGGVSAF